MRYRFIGDTILTIPLLRQLRHLYPNTTIDMLVGPNSGELLAHCPYVDNLIFFDTTRKHVYENSENTKPPTSYWDYVKQLRCNNYDVALVLKRSFSSAALAWLAGIPYRVGFATEGRQWLLTKSFPYDKTKPEWDCFLDALRTLGHTVSKPPNDHPLASYPSEADKTTAQQRLAHSVSPLNMTALPQHIAIHATSSNTTKALPTKVFIQLSQKLLSAYPNLLLHTFGAPQDAAVYEAIRNNLSTNNQPRLINHCGQTTLLESQAMLAQCQLIAGVDSGTLHMAAAASTPVVGVLLPELINKWSPMPLANGPEHVIIPKSDNDQAMVTALWVGCQSILQPQKTLV